METKDLRSVIFLDIETFSGEKPSKDSITADGRLNDPVKIANDIEKRLDSEWRKQSLDSIKGEVWCIGLAVDDEDDALCIRGDDEEDTMIMFDTWLTNFSYPSIVAHNGMEFDFLWLFHKGLKYGLKNVVNHFSASNKQNLKDTMQIMKGPSWKTYVSLDNMAKLLGFDGKGDIDGGQVHDMVLDGKDDQIKQYCLSDVNVLRKCYKRLNELGLYS